MVVRPWTIAIYESAAQVRYKPAFKIPTANLIQSWKRVTSTGRTYIEIMTLDLQVR